MHVGVVRSRLYQQLGVAAADCCINVQICSVQAIYTIVLALHVPSWLMKFQQAIL